MSEGFFNDREDKPASRRSKSPPNTDYRGFLKEVISEGNHFPLPRPYACALGLDAAAVALHLINVGQKKADKDGWVMATVGFMENGINLDDERQKLALHVLQEYGIAEIQHRGPKRVRWVRIDVNCLKQVVRKRTEEDQ